MASTSENRKEVNFEEFCDEWLRELREGNLSPLEKGRHFAFKLVTQWLGITEDDDDLELCDGSWDGGIDVAYLHREDADDDGQDDQSAKGHTWYLIQSKYGTAFQGPETVVKDGRKVISTLSGENTNLSEDVLQLLGRLRTFMDQATDSDRVVLVFATEKPMSETDRQALRDIHSIGRERISPFFDVEDISLQTIWENRDSSQQPSISLPITGEFIDPSSGIRVGAIPLPRLYEFLAAYRERTGNLDQLYDKNVRQFLGTRRKINSGIAKTLRTTPELFGHYNNGITIVVSDYSVKADGSCVLFDPYIVNGCQTTRTIWNELRQKFDAGGSGSSIEAENWRSRADRGVVVAKIIKGDDTQINDITRFTNSQNAVQERDFIALSGDFRNWANIMAGRYGIFLETQRGGWDAQKALQKSRLGARQFSEFANAFELLKVYGAGWLRVPGTAYRKNSAFAPGGTVFKLATSGNESIGPEDLYAAYRLKEESNQFKFGRNRELQSRGQTRFLFYYVVLEFLRDTLMRANHPNSQRDLTNALLKLFKEDNQGPLQALLTASVEVIDEYLHQESEDSVFKEPNFQGSLNLFLNMEQLGNNEDFAPLLKSLLEAHKRLFGRSSRGQLSPREAVIGAI